MADLFKVCLRPSNSIRESIRRRLAGEMVLAPAQNSGSYFEQQQRDTQLYQWSQTLHLRPMERAGRHLLTFGYSYAHSSYEGNVGNFPVQVLREDGTLSSRIGYGNALDSQTAKEEFACLCAG